MLFQLKLLFVLSGAVLVLGQSDSTRNVPRSDGSDVLQTQNFIEYVPPQIPHLRVRRQSIFGQVDPNHVTVGGSGTIYNGDGHSIDASGRVSRTFPDGSTIIGGGIEYDGPRAGASLNVGHGGDMGTSFGVGADANLWRSDNGRSTLDANANYNQNFGGAYSGQPNYGGGLTFRHNF